MMMTTMTTRIEIFGNSEMIHEIWGDSMVAFFLFFTFSLSIPPSLLL